ncbi:MAG: alpha/beta hydrolase [Verrucomicrobiota bacterium]
MFYRWLSHLSSCALVLWVLIAGSSPMAQTPEMPAPLGIPKPGPTQDGPYAPQPIVQGGIILPLYPPDSPKLHANRVREAEHYNLSKSVPGRISWITNIHNPSIEVHTVEGGLNTGAAVILCAGGGHRTLNVGSESADFVPYFHQYGVSTIILRNRLRADGYDVQKDAVEDALEAIRRVRAHAAKWNIDPKKIGIMGFSAGAELSAAAAIRYAEFDRSRTNGPWAGISSRPDFTVLVYPGPSPFARGARPEIPKDVPPSFVVCPGSGDRGHAIWALEYYDVMLRAGVPNIEMHLYGHGRHPGEVLPDGSRMAAGLADRNGIPFGRWQDRFIEWFRDCGFLQKSGLETRAARESAAFAEQAGKGPTK